jgi:hypothetical protein
MVTALAPQVGGCAAQETQPRPGHAADRTEGGTGTADYWTRGPARRGEETEPRAPDTLGSGVGTPAGASTMRGGETVGQAATDSRILGAAAGPSSVAAGSSRRSYLVSFGVRPRCTVMRRSVPQRQIVPTGRPVHSAASWAVTRMGSTITPRNTKRAARSGQLLRLVSPVDQTVASVAKGCQVAGGGIFDAVSHTLIARFVARNG